MTSEEHEQTLHALLRVRVITDGDPSVLPRLLGYLQNLNVTPRQVIAEFASTARMHVQIDVSDLPQERVTLITAKIAQNRCVLNTYWHYLV
jgi:hypothetical protein